MMMMMMMMIIIIITTITIITTQLSSMRSNTSHSETGKFEDVKIIIIYDQKHRILIGSGP